MAGDHHTPRIEPLPVAASRNPELKRLMRQWRSRLDPAIVPELLGSRRKRQVSQEDVARLAGTSAYWYGTLERGIADRTYSDDFLDRVAYTLRLNPDERRVLYLLAVEREPSMRDVVNPPGINDVVRRVVDGQPWPAYISDASWDVVAYNERLVQWFPWIPYKINIMLWVFTYPEAHHRLHDWETVWAPPMLAQMRMARATDRDNERLAELIDEILRKNTFARNLWDSEAAVVQHPDGDRRQIRIPPDDRLQTVEIVASTLFRAPTTRMLMMVPIDDEPHQRTRLTPPSSTAP